MVEEIADVRRSRPSFPETQVERLPPLRLPLLDRLELFVVIAAGRASAALRDAPSSLDRCCKREGNTNHVWGGE